MNFNYSYRSFLITSLLTGCLILLLYSMKLSKAKTQQESNEETYNLVMTAEDLLPEDLAIAELTPEMVKIETNRAYNEAEKFISSVESEKSEMNETTESKLQEMAEAMESSINGTTVMSKATEKPVKEKNKQLSGSDIAKNNETKGQNVSRNTTISYQLVNRTGLDLPNPVYTCYGFGKIVITIEVNKLGRVVKNSFNKSASTTTNECLIDAALAYSERARFNTDASKELQIGTITFNFPGQ